jgi:hypothetical protein
MGVNTMTAQTLNEMLEVLSAKFGTTVEHLWGILIRQNIMESIVCLSVQLILVMVSVFFYFKTKKYVNSMDPNYFDDTPAFVWGIFWFISGSNVLVLLCNLSTYITAFLNPEYAALTKIIEIMQ